MAARQLRGTYTRSVWMLVQESQLLQVVIDGAKPRYRSHKRLVEMAENQVYAQETFDFAWFKRWATSKRESIRSYAIETARYEMSHWVASGNVGFKDLRPFFSGYFDVQSSIVNGFTNRCSQSTTVVSMFAYRVLSLQNSIPIVSLTMIEK